MADRKRNIQGYEVIHAIQFCGSELILAENPKAEARYMVCDCSRNNPLGAEMYDNAMGSADFVEIMKLFAARLAERVVALETERETRGIPLEVLTAKNCQSTDETELEGRVVVIRAECLAPEYRTIDNQLQLCTGGFGSSPKAIGRTVYCQDLISGAKSTWKRENLVGFMPEERLPEWARINLDALRGPAGKEAGAVSAAEPSGHAPDAPQQPAEKDSVLEKIRQDRQNKQSPDPQKTKTKKPKKDGPEL